MHKAAHFLNRYGTTRAFILLSIVAPLLLLLSGDQRNAYFVALSAASVGGVVFALKRVARIGRPHDAHIYVHSSSFPSGHAAASWALATVVYGLVPYDTTIGLITIAAVVILAVLISISRIVLKVHRVHEVLIGTLIGIVLPLALTYLIF